MFWRKLSNSSINSKGQNFELVQKVAFYQDQVRGFFKLQSEWAALFASPPANALNTEKES